MFSSLIRAVVALTAVSVFVPTVLAEEQKSVLDRMVVTPNRTPIDQDDSLVPIIVIDRDDIERSQALDVADLLRFHAGLDIARNGGPGQTTSLFTRGTDSNHTLVLIDGVKVNPGSIGGAAFQNIMLEMIERIEVVAGPRSTLYGSEAIGGVVNIITRRPTRPQFDVGLSGGHYSTIEARASGRFIGKAGALGFSVERLETDGFPTRAESDLNRGYDNTTVNLDATTDFGPVETTLRYWQAEGNTEYLGFSLEPLDQDYKNSTASLTFNMPLAQNWDTRVVFSNVVDDISQNQPNEFTGDFDFVETNRNSIDWQNEGRVGDKHRVVAGIQFWNEDVQSLSFGTGYDEDTTDTGVYVSDHIRWDQGALLLAARLTDDEIFGSHTTWNAEIGFDTSKKTRLTLAAGTAFRAPDATDRFGFGGNPNLMPETSESLELGVQSQLNDRNRITASLFQTEIDDLIEFVFDPMTFGGTNENIGRAKIQGVDANYFYAGDNWQLRVGGTLQDPENSTDGGTLPRRAKKSLTASIFKQISRFHLGGDLLATGKRRDTSFSDATMAGYVLLNLSSRFDINDTWSVTGKVENALDTDYETAAGFNMPGRGFYVEVAYRADR